MHTPTRTSYFRPRFPRYRGTGTKIGGCRFTKIIVVGLLGYFAVKEIRQHRFHAADGPLKKND
ncbi:hypothetical protein BJX99DRAFT_228523 [Aspergillus californicus]